MNVGTKIKSARTHAGLTQDELAARLCVSRQAITKWENGKGVPDIENLKALAALFDISVDRLIGDEPLAKHVMREPVDLAAQKPVGAQRDRFDAAVRARYPDAISIQPLVRRKRLSRWESVLDFIGQPGLIQLADSVNHYSGNYVVDAGAQQLLVTVTKTQLESRELASAFVGKKLVVGDVEYLKAPYVI